MQLTWTNTKLSVVLNGKLVDKLNGQAQTMR